MEFTDKEKMAKYLGDTLLAIENSEWNSYISSPINVVQNRLVANTDLELGLDYLLNYQTIRMGLAINLGIYVSKFFEFINSNEKYMETLDDNVKLYRTDTESELAKILNNRRSIRQYIPNKFSLEDLSNILVNAQCNHNVNGLNLRNTPSGGGLYPITLYIAVQHVQGIEPGLYQFHPISERLSLLRTDFDKQLSEILKYQTAIEYENASCIVFFAFDYLKTFQKYGDLALSLGFIEVGMISQTLHLLSREYKYASCDIGGFDKVVCDDFLGLDGINSHSIYVMTIGEV